MSASPDNEAFDLLLRGGHVIDPRHSLSAVLDVAISGGKVAQVAPDLPSHKASRVLDVAGLYVTPGIIDMHCHVFVGHARSTLSVPPALATFSAGVTTVVDAGTSGWRDFPEFKERIIDRAKIRVLAYVNIVGRGMAGDWEHDTDEMRPTLAAAVAGEYADLVVGIKTAHYWANRPFDAAHPPWAAVERAVQAGELCNKPVMVDFWPAAERPYPELILEKLRPGDIHTHVFAQQFPILDDTGMVQPHMRQARERGIIFDLGHGAASFWYRNAMPAIEQGFLPDSISTDLHTGNVNGPVFDMLTTMNKCLNMGISLEGVIARSTWAPAQEIGHPELGSLSAGNVADITVFRLQENGVFPLVDCGKATLVGDRALQCLLTLRAGEAVYNPTGLGLPEWQDAPDAYWWDPARRVSMRRREPWLRT
ncbi:MAG TPA: amidohydrolase/deacetylase family metallohydrolase [Chloroflexota bacterium]|nr:amidohydrolase/deacetylase family metallohydrolase [Chloroflexota bacterium]